MSEYADPSLDLNNVRSIEVGLASPEQIRSWSHGEVTKPETINYKTHKPEPDGLFCEKIFGPKKDNECHCGKLKKKHKDAICPVCGVETTTSKVRRIRMGYIDLVTPIAHHWYYKGIPSRMSNILDIPQKDLEKILVYNQYVVFKDIAFTVMDEEGNIEHIELKRCQPLSADKYRRYKNVKGENGEKLEAGIGGEAIERLLKEIDLDALSKELNEAIESRKNGTSGKVTATSQSDIARLTKRLDTVEMFRNSHTPPVNMMIRALPVIPPDLRPLLQLEGGRFGTSDLTEFYRKIIYRNNTLKKQMQCGAPSLIVNQQKRMLQTAVDALFENSKRAKPFTGSGNRPLKSLSDMLRGKQGRFRQNLLGKRVDYSGRSVIVVGPELKIYQCGVPKEMALELFKPFVVRKLVSDCKEHISERTAEDMIEKGTDSRVWSSLEQVIKGHPVLLNRAPTLHRLGIQAFEPVLVEGKALKLHPLVCTAFNADFDGDQMAIHIPLSVEAQTEARFLMLSVNNLLAPKDGKPITVPTQDMVLGSYYLTLIEDEKAFNEAKFQDLKCYKNYNEAKLAYDLGMIQIHTPIAVKMTGTFEGQPITQKIKTTIGRLIFNEAIPQDIGFVDRSKRENALTLEINMLVKKGTLGEIIDKCIKKHGLTKSAIVIDDIKALGYKYSTRAALTVSVSDIMIPDIKEKMIAEAEAKVESCRNLLEEGQIDEDARYKLVIDIWNKTTDDLTEILKNSMDKLNPIHMMADSGARGSMNQIKQLAGMRGLMSSTSGKTIEIPIKSNFREGLNIIEFFISSHGTRKTLSDTALRTADSGYLTRRLVYASQEVVIREMDCGTHAGIMFKSIANPEKPEDKPLVPLADRIRGRYVADDVIDPATGEIICDRETLINDEIIAKIKAAGITEVKVRSVIECECKYGVCAKCYGSNLATNNICSIGEVVGIIAAQSIGEPGTQLTMRTFHTGGVATADDITQGLPRVEELFEARKPKGAAVISQYTGTLQINEKGNSGEVEVTVTADDGQVSDKIVTNKNLLAKVKGENGQPAPLANGARIQQGEAIVAGSKDPHDVFNILGDVAVENYIIEEVQKVYNSQGVKINDRHLEVIVRQMLRQIKITDRGDSDFIEGSLVEKNRFEAENKKLIAKGLTPATGDRQLLGITKAVLNSESFLSACSFQETTKVLTDAAIRGKRDYLRGLKENILLGKLIPAGTGLVDYNGIEVSGELPENVRKLKQIADENRQKRAKTDRYDRYNNVEISQGDGSLVETDEIDYAELGEFSLTDDNGDIIEDAVVLGASEETIEVEDTTDDYDKLQDVGDEGVYLD